MLKAKLWMDVEAPNQSQTQKKIDLLKGLTNLLAVATDLCHSFWYVNQEYQDHSFVLEGLAAMILRDSILAFNDSVAVFNTLISEMKSPQDDEGKQEMRWKFFDIGQIYIENAKKFRTDLDVKCGDIIVEEEITEKLSHVSLGKKCAFYQAFDSFKAEKFYVAGESEETESSSNESLGLGEIDLAM